MTFTSAIFIFGAIFGLIPIIIHMIYKRKSRVVKFPSLMFFKTTNKKFTRLHNLRELIILILRVSALILLALGLANPIITDFGYFGGSSTGVVILLDDSYSMQAAIGTESMFDRAKRKAYEILSSLNEGESAAIIFLNELHRKEKTYSLTTDIERLKERILTSNGSQGSATLEKGLRYAQNLLTKSSLPNKECYVISDFREAAFADAPINSKQAEDLITITDENRQMEPPIQNTNSDLLTEVAVSIDLFLIDIKPKTFNSYAISEIEIDNYKLTANIPFNIKVHIKNWSKQSGSGTVELFELSSEPEELSQVYKSKDFRKPVNFSTNQKEAIVNFEIPPKTAGKFSGLFQLKMSTESSDSDIKIDNIRYFSVEIKSKIPILIVNGEPSNVSIDDEVFYLAAALNPEQNSSIYDPVIIETEQIDFDRIANFQALILCNVSFQDYDLTEENLLAMKKYLYNGGKIIFFPGDLVNSQKYNNIFRDNNIAESLLPADFISIKTQNPNAKSTVKLDKLTHNIDIFRNLQKLHPELIRFSKYWKLEVSEADSSCEVISKFSNGDPFLLKKFFGLGEIYLFANPCDREWSNLPLRKLFPIMIYRILKNRNHQGNYIFVGENFSLPSFAIGNSMHIKMSPPPIELEFNTKLNHFKGSKLKNVFAIYNKNVDPNDELEISNKYNRRIAFPFEQNNVLQNSTQFPGVYFYQVTRNQIVEDFKAFCVNPDAKEANPDIKTFAQIKTLLPTSKVIAFDTAISEFIFNKRKGTSLWLILFLTAFCAIIVESILANSKLPGAKKEEFTKTLEKLRSTGFALHKNKHNDN